MNHICFTDDSTCAQCGAPKPREEAERALASFNDAGAATVTAWDIANATMRADDVQAAEEAGDAMLDHVHSLAHALQRLLAEETAPLGHVNQHAPEPDRRNIHARAGASIDALLIQDIHLWCDLGSRLSCSEAEAFAEFLRAHGESASADGLMQSHADEDREGDDHYIEPEAIALAAKATQHPEACPKTGAVSDAVTCGNCDAQWCERCDPAPSAQCHYCNGRGYSTAEIRAPKWARMKEN